MQGHVMSQEWEPVDFLLMSFGPWEMRDGFGCRFGHIITFIALQRIRCLLYYIGLQTLNEGNPNNFVDCILYALHKSLAPFNLKTK